MVTNARAQSLCGPINLRMMPPRTLPRPAGRRGRAAKGTWAAARLPLLNEPPPPLFFLSLSFYHNHPTQDNPNLKNDNKMKIMSFKTITTLFFPVTVGVVLFLLAHDANAAKPCCRVAGNSPMANGCEHMDSCGPLGWCDAGACPPSTEGILTPETVVIEVSRVERGKAEAQGRREVLKETNMDTRSATSASRPLTSSKLEGRAVSMRPPCSLPRPLLTTRPPLFSSRHGSSL